MTPPYFMYFNPAVATTEYLYDSYPFSHAYSLRKLKSTATYAIRVRRSSDNTETDIGFVGYDLDTSTLGTFCSGTSGFITTWYDQGSTLRLTMSTSANQPRIYNAGTLDTKGSLPCINFISSDYLESATAMSILSHGNAYSFYTVSSANATETAGAIFCTSRTSADRLVQFCDSRTTPNRNFFIQNSGATSYLANLSAARVNTNQRYLSGFVTTGKAMSAFDNGATGGTDTYTGTYTNDRFLCGVQHAGTFYLTGQIQEMIFYNSDTSADRTSIEADIVAYYGL